MAVELIQMHIAQGCQAKDGFLHTELFLFLLAHILMLSGSSCAMLTWPQPQTPSRHSCLWLQGVSGVRRVHSDQYLHVVRYD